MSKASLNSVVDQCRQASVGLQRRYPLLAMALATWLGCRAPAPTPLWLLPASGLLLLRRQRLAVVFGEIALGLWLGAGLIGGSPPTLCPPLAISAERAHPPSRPTDSLTGVVRSLEPARDGRTSAVLDLLGGTVGGLPTPLRCRALFSLGRRRPEVWVGDRVWLPRPDLEPPVHLSNPGDNLAFDGLAALGVDRVGSLPDGAAVVALAHVRAPARWWAQRAAQADLDLVSLPPEPARDLVRLFALDQRAALNRSSGEAFRASGLGHLLSLGLLYLLAWWGLVTGGLAWLWGRSERLALAVPSRRAAAVLGLPVPACYGLLASGAGAQRAAAVGFALALGLISGRARPRALHLYSLGLLAWLASDPEAARGAGALWSLLALIGIAWLASPVLARLGKPASVGGKAVVHALGALAVGAAVMLATLPLQLLAGGPLIWSAVALSPIGLALALPTCLLAQAGALLGERDFLAAALIPARALDGLAASGANLATQGGALWLALPPAALIPAAIGGTLGVGLWLRQSRLVGPILVGSALALGIAGAWLPRANPLRLTFFSVGHGDATLIETPHGHAILIDGGGAIVGDFDPGWEVVVPFLRQHAIRRLDAVILSHPHPDHANGLPAVLRSVEVGELWQSGEPCPLPACDELTELARAHGIVRRPLGSAPFRRWFDGVELELLSPAQPQGYDPALGPNDNSLVFRLRYGKLRALLTGDIEAAAEARLVASGADLSADVLKAPHHGSDTSSTERFVAKVRPQAVVFSAGLRNRFGFPRPSVRARYRRWGAALFRTDLDGALTVESDGEVARLTPAGGGPATVLKLQARP